MKKISGVERKPITAVKSATTNDTSLFVSGNVGIISVLVRYASTTTSTQTLFQTSVTPAQETLATLMNVSNNTPVLAKLYTSGSIIFITSVPADAYVEGEIVFFVDD